MKKIKLSQGQHAIVDDEDYDDLSMYRWHAVKRGHKRIRWYARRATYVDRQRSVQYMHNFLLGTYEIDHIDGNGLNNRRSNLRVATAGQQSYNQNKPMGNFSSVFKGVTWAEDRGKWRAQIMFKGKNYQLGQFDNEVDAALAYDKAAKEKFGEFAHLNFGAD